MKPAADLLKISPSQINTYRACPRAYAYSWTHGFWPPSTIKQEFGSQVHGALESWLSKGQFEDFYSDRKNNKLPIKKDAIEVAKQGICQPYFPLPDDPGEVEKELHIPIGNNLSLYGFIDYVGPGNGRFTDRPIVIDHKTTSDFRWMKTEKELATDPQAIIYSAWAMLNFKCHEVIARWIYYKSTNPKTGPRKPKGVKYVERVFSAENGHFLEEVRKIEHDMQQIAWIRRNKIAAEKLAGNASSCQNYGGCYHLDRCSLTPGERLASFIK